jgi:hypothetical protein
MNRSGATNSLVVRRAAPAAGRPDCTRGFNAVRLKPHDFHPAR